MRNLFIIVLLSLALKISAQKPYEFSNYTDKYIYELDEFLKMRASKETKKKVDLIILEFKPFWDSDTLSKEEKKSIIKMSNMMSKKRFKARPSFTGFLKNILAIKRDNINNHNFNDWLKSIEYFVKRKRGGLLHKYFKASQLFFEKHYIQEKAQKVWKVDSARIKIEIIDNKPIFVFDTITLIGTTGVDSSYIWKTTGKYYPLKARWYGVGGKVFWTRLGIDESTIWANLKFYKISLKSAIWRADSVMFYDRRKFSEPLMGKFNDKIFYNKQKESTHFPSFSSYRFDLVMKDVFKNVDYQGGYSLRGLRMIGSGVGKNKAYFIFKHKGKKFVYAGAQTFIIQKDKIVSEKVNITIYLESVDSITKELTVDSIYHPALSLYFSAKDTVLSIYRKEEGMSRTPFADSYHKVDLYVEELKWKLGDDYIDMKSILQKGIESSAKFESSNFFSTARYEYLQGLDKINPVEAIYEYTQHRGFNEFYAEGFANYMQMGKAQTISYLLNLATKGFLIYDTDEQYVIVKEAVRVYVMANAGKTDYDVIAFNSRTNGVIPNASLSLLDNNLILQGIGMVHLSDSQDVRIVPKNGRVELRRNRDFVFDGKIMAGRFDLYAHNVYFSYDKFELDMPSIDSLSFKVEAFEENVYGERPLVRVRNVIEKLRGNILIDHPNNKSGRESYPKYPILTSKVRSFVYYDKSSIYNKVYNREKFFYRLESFVIDSLDDFKTDGLEFKGYLSSGGIFPDLADPLKVMDDYSLGFVTVTPDAGLSVYGGAGRYNDTIKLSNAGLHGSGELTYLTSTGKSKSFDFFPDSTNAILTEYTIKEVKSGVEYPPVVATNLKMDWQPYKDNMHTSTIKEDEPFKMYDKEAILLGSLHLSSHKLDGSGLIKIKNAEMESDLFKFKNKDYKSDSCMFRLRTFVSSSEEELESLEQENEFAFATTDMFSTDVDFVKRKADFVSHTGAKKVDFAENMYMCYMDQFVWYMDEDKTEFSSKDDPIAQTKGKSIREIADLKLSGTEFISTHPNQDSIRFFAQKGVYLQRKKLIHAYGVPSVNVADAAVFPGNKEIKIFAKAEMEEITDAKLLVNRETKYHELYSGTFKLKGLHDYSGRGIYDYKDEDGLIQNIYFGNISVDTAFFTIGIAKIEKSANFTLSSAFDFIGDVALIGTNKYLKFTGGTSIHHKCDTLQREPIQFTAQIDPANIRIPIGEDLKNSDGNYMFSGIKAKQINGQVYSSFLSGEGRRTDNVVMKSFGYLVFNKITQEYRIASEDKLAQRSLPGNYLALNKRDCSVYGEGVLDVAYGTGHVQATAYGRTRYFSREDSSIFDVCIPLNFHFNKKAEEIIANEINDHMDLSSIDLYENEIYNMMLNNKLGLELYNKYHSKLGAGGGEYRKIPKDLISTIFISNVKMKYNKRSRSLVSVGQIGIASIGKTQILKYVDGKIEIKNKKSEYIITIAIDLGNKEYYYFQIKGNSKTGQMLTYSSNKEYVALIKDSKADDRKIKDKKTKSKFNYYLAAPTKFKFFMRKMKRAE